jgi:hypothetical protein
MSVHPTSENVMLSQSAKAGMAAQTASTDRVDFNFMSFSQDFFLIDESIKNDLTA